MTTRDFFNEYLELRKNIFEESLYILKSEYVHVLYKLYITLMRKFIHGCCINKELDTVAFEASKKKRVSLKSDFTYNQKYAREISYLEKFLEGPFNAETVKHDKELSRIFSPNFKVVLSRYGYQMLLSVVEMNGYQNISNVIFQRDDRKLLVSNNSYTESYVGESYIDDAIGISEVELTNSKNYTTGMLRDNFNYLKDLERVIQKKKTNIDKNIDVELGEKYPIEKSSNFFMSNCPEYKNKYLVDFAKDYINRKTVNTENPPSVLILKVTDLDEKITCVETNQFFKLAVLGFMNGKIKVYFFTEDSDKEYKEEYRKEFQKLQTGESCSELLKPITEIPNVSLSINCVQLLGHSSAVTSMSLNYDDFYLVSGSCDASVRLWNCKTGICLAVYNAHVRTIWSVKFGPKGYYFASGGNDKVVYFWATNKVLPLKRFIGHTEEITKVEFTKNMIYLVSASLDNTIRFWNLEDNTLIRIFYFENNISCFQLDEVGSMLVVGDSEGQIVVWNVEKALRVLKTNVSGNSSIEKSGKSILGIGLAYDETAVVVYTFRGFRVYDFQSFREDKSKDVYKKFEKQSNAFQKDGQENLFKPFLEFEQKDLKLMSVFFNFRNLLIVIARNFGN